LNNSFLKTDLNGDTITLLFGGEFTLYQINKYETLINTIDFSKFNTIKIDLKNLDFIDTASAIFLNNLYNELLNKNKNIDMDSNNKDISKTLKLVQNTRKTTLKPALKKKENFIKTIGKEFYKYYLTFISFLSFFGKVFIHLLYIFKKPKALRYKEILFEINETAIKAFFIVALSSFLVGIVIAYQSANQLSLYGANIFIVDMIGLSMLRELSPVITAVIIAGRSGSAFTAQIGAMKITQELDAMRSMGFEPYMFLVLPRIIALIIMMPVLIFISDIAAIFGSMIIADVNLGISFELFLDRFSSVIEIRHFLVGIFKGPFFAILIASIAIYRGLMVKDDTQSIGYNTTKSVVESIFAVIICDAFFSIIFTNLGI
jgi:phospholipid/cholesterol/gamma-HCH transport system permease protein